MTVALPNTLVLAIVIKPVMHDHSSVNRGVNVASPVCTSSLLVYLYESFTKTAANIAKLDNSSVCIPSMAMNPSLMYHHRKRNI